MQWKEQDFLSHQGIFWLLTRKPCSVCKEEIYSKDIRLFNRIQGQEGQPGSGGSGPRIQRPQELRSLSLSPGPHGLTFTFLSAPAPSFSLSSWTAFASLCSQLSTSAWLQLSITSRSRAAEAAWHLRFPNSWKRESGYLNLSQTTLPSLVIYSSKKSLSNARRHWGMHPPFTDHVCLGEQRRENERA